MAPLKIIIVGGGLAGACMANGLINKGGNSVEVSVFERDTEASSRDGYQIRLGAHALVGFRACLTKQQYEELLRRFGRSGGVVSSAPAIYNSDMKLLLDLSKFPAYEKSAPIGRARLRNFLQEPLREKNIIRYGKKFERFEVLNGKPDSGAKIRVHFQDGSSEDCDILLSAEGSSSRANRQLGCNNIVDDDKLGAGALLGKCHLPWTTLCTLPRPIIEKGTIFTTNAKSMLFAAAYLPDSLVACKQETSIADELSDINKPNNYDEEQASLMVAVGWTEGPSSMEATQMSDKRAFMREKLTEGKCHPDFFKLVEALDPKVIQGIPWRFAKDTPINWRQQLLSNRENATSEETANPRVWLIGDAIHPMLPTRGMGANQAIHDTADALGPLLELAKKKQSKGALNDQEIRDALAVFEIAMIPRAFTWVRRSSAQVLPDLESFKGKLFISGVRILLLIVGVGVNVIRFFGWRPRDDAPELP